MSYFNRFVVWFAFIILGLIGLRPMATAQEPAQPLVENEKKGAVNPPRVGAVEWPSRWHSPSEFVVPRSRYGIVQLADGRVLVAGGYARSQRSTLKSVEIFDPASGRWSLVGELIEARADPTIYRDEDGRVFVGGGDAAGWERYDPEADRWTKVEGTPSLGAKLGRSERPSNDERVRVQSGAGKISVGLVDDATLAAGEPPPGGDFPHTLYQSGAGALLSDGRVFVAGGRRVEVDCEPGDCPYSTSEAMHAAFIYDPKAETRQAVAGLPRGRYGHHLVTLPGDRVLLFGGDGDRAEETMIYDPVTDRWRVNGMLSTARKDASVFILRDGDPIIIGGGGPRLRSDLARVRRFDLQAGRWTFYNMLVAPRSLAEAAPLDGERVALIGGCNAYAQAPTVEVVKLTPSGSVTTPVFGGEGPRCGHTATRGGDGAVWIIGGNDRDGDVIKIVEKFDPTDQSLVRVDVQPIEPRAYHSAVALASGELLVLGGHRRGRPTPLQSVERLDVAKKTWSAMAPMPTPLRGSRAVQQSDGRVLVWGQRSEDQRVQVLFYDASKDRWSEGATLNAEKMLDRDSVVLADGRLLLVGGGMEKRDAYIYDPSLDRWFSAGQMTDGRAYSDLLLMPSGDVLITGGDDKNNASVASSEFFVSALNRFVPGPTLLVTRSRHVSAVFPSGDVIVAGGSWLADDETDIERAKDVAPDLTGLSKLSLTPVTPPVDREK